MSESTSGASGVEGPDRGPVSAERRMFETMARMQDEHNCQVHPQWRTQGYEYYRAIWVECAELLDHFGWKWWKQQIPDLEQSRLELVDIWHFGLSELIRDEAPDSAAVQALFALRSEGPGDAVAFREAVEALAQQTLAQRGFVLEEFVAALAALPMSFVELYELYIGKNVLNRFRQDHGYKDGTYQKVWFGREDNEHLVEVIGSLDVGMTDYVSRVYEALDARYPESP